MAPESLATLPNLVSLSRVAMAVGFVLLPQPSVRLALIVAAALTDFVDGWLARRQHSDSRWGALIDPFADRLFVFTAVVVLLVEGRLSTLQYFVLLSRDLATSGAFLLARMLPSLRGAVFQSRLSGKVTTVVQFLALLAATGWPSLVGPTVLIVALLSVYSIADYAIALWGRPPRA